MSLERHHIQDFSRRVRETNPGVSESCAKFHVKEPFLDAAAAPISEC